MEMEMEFLRKLPTPQELKEQFPVSTEVVAAKAQRDEEIRNIFEGKDDRLILVIGPCSADNEDAVIDYISRLRTVQEKVKDKIFIIPRIYTNKPRTIGVGYKGMLHQPDPEKKEDMLKGIIAIRELHTRAVKETGFTCADEMLYPENHRYLSDLLSYVAVGARSVEDQQHRLTASGVGIPVGMKNPTGGDISVMMNSMIAAQHGHTFLYRGWEVTTTGLTPDITGLIHCRETRRTCGDAFRSLFRAGTHHKRNAQAGGKEEKQQWKESRCPCSTSVYGLGKCAGSLLKRRTKRSRF